MHLLLISVRETALIDVFDAFFIVHPPFFIPIWVVLRLRNNPNQYKKGGVGYEKQLI
jgi:hypothetical protein